MSEPGDETPERELAEVEADFAFEGIFFTEEERELLLRYSRGEITREQYKAEVDKMTFGDKPDEGGQRGA